MNEQDLNDLRREFEQMAGEGACTLNPDQDRRDRGDEEDDDEDIPNYVEELQKKLLAPSISGVYLTRIDIKRIADDLDESLPIKERKKMLRALMRHTTTKATLQEIFDVTNHYINGRVLIYEELAAAFPASAYIFEENIKKAHKTQQMFDRIVEDFEDIDITEDPVII